MTESQFGGGRTGACDGAVLLLAIRAPVEVSLAAAGALRATDSPPVA
jgi:hypothetical protein